ncbi:MAG: hypothetical protein ACRBI6_07360 [Acidimicrobiales bacterium]
MAQPRTSRAVDRFGEPLPDSPDATAVEAMADRLRVVDDSELAPHALSRISAAELDQRHRRSQ